MLSARTVSMGNARASYAERGYDVYETPACAVEALLQAEILPEHVWEPAAGAGNIVNVLRAHGSRQATSPTASIF